MAHDIDDWNQPEIETYTGVVDVPIPRPFRWHAHGTAQKRIVKINSWTNEAVCWGPSVTDFYPIWGFGAQTGNIFTPQSFPLLESFTDVGTLFGPQEVIGYASGTFFDGGFAVMILADGSYWFCGYSTTGTSADGYAGAYPNNHREFWTQTATIPGNPDDFRYITCGDGALILHYRNGDCYVVGNKFYSGMSVHGLNIPEGNVTTFRKMAEKVVWVYTLDSATVICKADGRLKCTGLNQSARFGLATDPSDPGTDAGINPSGKVWFTVPEAHWSTGGGFVKAELQRYSLPNTVGAMVALKADGSLWFAGNNQTRIAGDPARAYDYKTGSLQRIPTVPAVKDFFLTDGAFGTVVALTQDNEVWTWGQGGGTGSLGTDTSEVLTPVKILEGVKQIMTKKDGCIAVMGDENLMVWGYGGFGTNGNGNNSNVGHPVARTVPRPDRPDVSGELLLGEPTLTITSQ